MKEEKTNWTATFIIGWIIVVLLYFTGSWLYKFLFAASNAR